MNYQEFAGIAPYQSWAAAYKAKLDFDNGILLAARQKHLDARTEIGVGDLVIDGKKTLRVAHDRGDSVQLTDGRFDASFYLGDDGFVDFSGGLDPAIPKIRFASTGERRDAPVWFFSQNCAMAHNGYHTMAKFRVWSLIQAY